jgi:zinc protease
MRSFVAVLLFLAIVFLTVPAFADNQPYKTKLDNGMTVVINELASSPMVALYAWVNTGSAMEGKYLGSGVTHFVEHMIFKGTARRGPGVIPAEAKAMGGVINASTGYDNTVFTLSVPKENFAKGLDLIADMVQNAAFDPKEVEREREVILKEMHMLNDRPDHKLDELVYDTVYFVHPYKNPIIGREPIFKALTREDLLDYYRSHYVPNNMVFSVAGGIRAGDALPQIKKAFENFVMRSLPVRDLPQEPEQIAARRVEVEYPTDLIRMTMAYQSVPLLHKDLYALDVLAMALGSGASSRFYQELHEKKQLVESITASNYTPLDRGFVEITCLIKDKDPNVVIQSVKALIEEVKKTGLMPDELEKVKRQVMVQNIYGRQSSEDLAYRTAMEEAFTGDPTFSEKYLEGVRRVTNADIKRVAAEYLIGQRLSVVILKPKTTAAQTPETAAVTPLSIEKIVLSNGLVLLLQEDHSLPILSIDAVINGGVRQEPVELNGLSQLTAAVWDKGLKGKTAEQISREVESRGGSFSIGSGFNSFTINIGFLAEDLPLAMDYLENAVKYPTFPQDEVNKEKDQMLTALAARKDSILQTTNRVMRETLFLTHPFRLDSLGSEKTLKKVSRKDLLGCYERFLSPNNMVIAVFGDMNKTKIKEEIIKRFGNLKPVNVTLKSALENAPQEPRIKELSMDKEQAVVMYGFRAPTVHDKDKYAFEIAVNILSSSLSGRMFKRIRDELGKAYGLSGGYSPGVDAGMANFFTLTTEENIPKVREIMEAEITNMRNEFVTDQELADAKAYLQSGLARSLETVSDRAMTSSIDELLGLGYDDYERYNERNNAVTKEEVREVVRKYLDLQRDAVIIMHSKSTDFPRPSN